MEEQGQNTLLPYRHRPGASMDTNASGISFNTLVTKQLAQFPQPPSEIPPSPITEFASPLATPIRSQFNSTPPLTPRRKGFQTDFRLPVSSRGSFSTRNTHAQGSSDSDTASNTSHISSTAIQSLPDSKSGLPHSSTSLGAPDRQGSLDSAGANRRSPLASHSPQNSLSTLPIYVEDQPAGRLPSKSSRRPPALNLTANTTSPHPSPTSSSPIASAHDWHDGYSGIVVDDNEDRMLSTSFITGLLASTQTTFENSAPLWSQQHDSTSGISEVTYPPSSPFRMQPPSLQSVQTTSAVGHNQHESETVRSRQGNEYPSVVRSVSNSKPGLRDTSVVGSASATLHHLQGPSTSQLSLHGSSSVPTGQTNGKEYNGPTSTIHSLALPSTIKLDAQFPDSNRNYTSARQSMHSIKSTKSAKSHVSSLISRISYAPVFSRFRRKPLPPLPVQVSITTETESEQRKLESGVALPTLVNRASTPSGMLERGHHPRNSLLLPQGGYAEVTFVTARGGRHSDARTSRGEPFPTRTNSPDSPKVHGSKTPKPKRRVLFLAAILVMVVVVAVILGVSLGVRAGRPDTKCSGNFTGVSCSLDATCVCTSATAGRCDQLAQSLVSLTPNLNALFRTDFTANLISTRVWEAQGAPLESNCASQAQLVDVAPALESSKAPNRTTWAQSALLWNLVESQDLGATKKMQSFINNAPWSDLGKVDGPVTPSPSFTLSISGFIFDFAAQTVSQPSVSFISNGNPTSEQAAQVGNTSRAALDRMYSFALGSSVFSLSSASHADKYSFSASSDQRQQAMATYWRTVLQQKPEDLVVFMSAVTTSPILVPFDAMASPNNQPLSDLLTNSSSTPFPPPLACYPGLNAPQVQTLNTVEASVFGLSSISAANVFDATCYADRPVYGVLDLLRLRLPFVESHHGAPKQAAMLKRDVASRAVLYSGSLFSVLPSTTTPQNLTLTQTDPRQYGTLNHLNHVMLNFLSSIPDINVAITLVKYLLSSPSIPPAESNALFDSIDSIPVLELAIFGSVTPSDVSCTVSSFSTPSGSLFFGSDQAGALRRWAVNATGSSVVWSELATSPQVVRDSSFTDSAFNSVWNPAATFLHSQQPGVVVGVSNITDAFKATGKFGP